MKTVILLSGGLDSVTCLLKLLSETKDEIQVLYIEIEANSAKAWVEKQAIDAILKQTKAIFREVEYKKSSINISGTASYLGQPQIWTLHASYAANEFNAKRICLGYTIGDCALKDLDLIEESWKSNWTLVNQSRKPPKLYLPVKNQTKSESLLYLENLQKKHTKLNITPLLWTCETPKLKVSNFFVGYEPCGECVPCGNAVFEKGKT